MTLNLFYKLDKNKNIVPGTMEECEEILANHDKKVVKQENVLDKFVSTVFLSIDHDFFLMKGTPIVFETMIHDETIDRWMDYQERYTTWDEAVKCHERAIQWVKDGCKEDE